MNLRSVKDCPSCGSRARCVDSRPGDAGIVRRRYACKCGTRFSTGEFLLNVGSYMGGRSLTQKFLGEQRGVGRREALERLVRQLELESRPDNASEST